MGLIHRKSTEVNVTEKIPSNLTYCTELRVLALESGVDTLNEVVLRDTV